ncbi:MAG: DUF167 domain-containing protein [Betaproteobacteria bacterium]
MSRWYRIDRDRNVLCIGIHVQPNARVTEVVGQHDDRLKIRVAAPAADGRANRVLLEFLSEVLELPARRIIIKRGARGREKAIEVDAPDDNVLRIIRNWDMT